MLFWIGVIAYLALMMLGGYAISRSPNTPVKMMMRASDKRKMKDAIRREAYYNQLYEECLYDEMDDMAIRAAKEMMKRDKQSQH